MIAMKMIAPTQQQNGLLLTMADLRKKRIELNMSSRTAAQYLGIDFSTLCKYERENSAPQHFFECYRDYIEGCSNGKIYFQQSANKSLVGAVNYKRQKNVRLVSLKQISQLRVIRCSLRIKQIIACKVLNKSHQALSFKETGRYPMLQTEYDALMKFYRQEKLKRIFGANYREGMMS